MVTGPAGTDGVVGFVGRMGTSGNEYYTACFWDSEVNPDVNGIGNMNEPNVIGLPTVEMQTLSTYTDAGWDFVDIWDICEEMNYPKFFWQIPPGDFLCPDGVSLIDYSFFTARWKHTNCGDANDCDGVDLDFSDAVDESDLKIFLDHWLTGLQ